MNIHVVIKHDWSHSQTVVIYLAHGYRESSNLPCMSAPCKLSAVVRPFLSVRTVYVVFLRFSDYKSVFFYSEQRRHTVHTLKLYVRINTG